MKNIKRVGFIMAFCFSQFFIQCSSDDSKEIEEKTIVEQFTDEVIELRNFLSTSLSIDVDKIIYDSGISSFIIDRDVVMPIEQARNHYSDFGLKNTNKITQQFSGYKLKPEIASSIEVYISPEVTSVWRIALNKAINVWNNTNSGINITTVNASTSLSVNVVMGAVDDRSTIAYAYLPSNGKPGTKLMISTTFVNKLNDAGRLHTMIHELGHTFGLSHTDSSSGSLIPCTSTRDTSSIMMAMHDETTTFTYYDDVAISTLYPVAVGTKKLYRFKKNGYYFYTTDPCEISHEKDGYVFDGDLGYIYSTEVPGTVPLYRTINGTVDKGHKMYTRTTETSNVIILGYLYSYQKSETTALYFVLNPKGNLYELENDHFNTTTGFVLHKFLRNKEVDIIF